MHPVIFWSFDTPSYYLNRPHDKVAGCRPVAELHGHSIKLEICYVCISKRKSLASCKGYLLGSTGIKLE